MGSFNTTCMVSGFPITPGTKCRLILLYTPRSSATSAPDHPNGLWAPLSLPIPVEYADYGRVDYRPPSGALAEHVGCVLQAIAKALPARGAAQVTPQQSYQRVDAESFSARELQGAKLDWWLDRSLGSDGRLKFTHPFFEERQVEGHYALIRDDVLATVLTADDLALARDTLYNALHPGPDARQSPYRKGEGSEEASAAWVLEQVFPWQHAWIAHVTKPDLYEALTDMSALANPPRSAEGTKHPGYELWSAVCTMKALDRLLEALSLHWTPRVTSGDEPRWKAHWDFHEGLARLADGFTPFTCPKCGAGPSPENPCPECP